MDFDYKKHKFDIPNKAGAYLYRDQDQQVIYVGKAKNLRKRTSQYFQNKRQDAKTKALVKDIAKLETIVTDSELDALFLESELIKRYQPRYNILLRDNKSTSYIRITKGDRPTINFTRQPFDDGAEYFGPFYNAYPIKQAMHYLRRIFPYLTPKSLTKNRSLINRQIGLEPELNNQQDLLKYKSDLRQIKLYIKGQRVQLIRELKSQMNQRAEALDFEAAAKLRNQIRQLEYLQNGVRINQINQLDQSDQSLSDLSKLFNLEQIKRIEGYDISHMSGTSVVASMVVFTNGLADRSEYRRFKIKIDQNNDFFNINETLARRAQRNWLMPDLILIDGGKGQLNTAIAALAKTKLAKVPIFSLAKKQELVIINNQYSNIELNQQFLSQNNIAFAREADFTTVDIANNQPVLKLLQRVRDEAHRFAVSYHSKLKKARQISSSLDHIKGVGPRTIQKLLKKYKTISKISQASESELAQLIGPNKAKLLKKVVKS